MCFGTYRKIRQNILTTKITFVRLAASSYHAQNTIPSPSKIISEDTKREPFFSFLGRGLNLVPRPRRLRDEKWAMGTRMSPLLLDCCYITCLFCPMNSGDQVAAQKSNTSKIRWYFILSLNISRVPSNVISPLFYFGIEKSNTSRVVFLTMNDLIGKIVVIKRNGADGPQFPLRTNECLFGR